MTKTKTKHFQNQEEVIEVEEVEEDEVDYSQEDASLAMKQAISPFGVLNGRKTKGEREE